MWRVVLSLILCAGCDVVWRVDHLDPSVDAAAGDASPLDATSQRGPFAHYTMEEVDAANHVVDVASGYDATCMSCPTSHVGKLAGALSFNLVAMTNRLEIQSAAPFAHLSAFSVAGWLEMDVNTGTACPWNKPYGGGDADSWQLCVTGSTLEFITEDGVPGDDLTVDESIQADSAWHHVAIVFDGVHKTIFVDGLRRATGTAGVPAVDNHPVVLGGDIDTVASVPMLKAPFQGELDDLQFFADALGDDEIMTLAGH